MTIIKILAGNKYPAKKSNPAIDTTRSFFYFSCAEKVLSVRIHFLPHLLIAMGKTRVSGT